MLPKAIILEDDAAQCEIFTAAVRKAGYEVLCFNDGEQGLEYLKTNTTDLIVLDLHLPGLGGEHIAHALRKLPHLSRARLILATADDRLADSLAELSDLILLKPVSYIQLCELAERLKP
ncbi:MAG: response regulator [Anaerolineae bacterium]